MTGAIIGTFQTKGGKIFWSIIVRMPIHANPIIAWKFCHTLHKILREGHPNVLVFINTILFLQSMKKYNMYLQLIIFTINFAERLSVTQRVFG